MSTTLFTQTVLTSAGVAVVDCEDQLLSSHAVEAGIEDRLCDYFLRYGFPLAQARSEAAEITSRVIAGTGDAKVALRTAMNHAVDRVEEGEVLPTACRSVVPTVIANPMKTATPVRPARIFRHGTPSGFDD